MDIKIKSLIEELGLGNDVEQMLSRPESLVSHYYSHKEWLYHNQVYGVILAPGQSIGSWLDLNIGAKDSQLVSSGTVVLTPLPLSDLNTSTQGSAATISFDGVHNALQVIDSLKESASLICIGPVLALSDEHVSNVSSIVEKLIIHCAPRYQAFSITPPVLLFSDGDAVDKQDIRLMRHYLKMLN